MDKKQLLMNKYGQIVDNRISHKFYKNLYDVLWCQFHRLILISVYARIHMHIYAITIYYIQYKEIHYTNFNKNQSFDKTIYIGYYAILNIFEIFYIHRKDSMPSYHCENNKINLSA